MSGLKPRPTSPKESSGLKTPTYRAAKIVGVETKTYQRDKSLILRMYVRS